jgi:hypothetical protein
MNKEISWKIRRGRPSRKNELNLDLDKIVLSVSYCVRSVAAAGVTTTKDLYFGGLNQKSHLGLEFELFCQKVPSPALRWQDHLTFLPHCSLEASCQKFPKDIFGPALVPPSI